MSVASLISARSALPGSLQDLPPLPLPDTVAFVRPDFYDAEVVLNPHMEGQIGKVNRFEARRQWRDLVEAYRRLAVEVEIWDARPLLPDQVFCANVALPLPPAVAGDAPMAVAAIMASARRQAEVAPAVGELERRGIEVLTLNPFNVARFEGTGDAIWHPSRALLFGGWGPRSVPQAYEVITAWTGVPVVLLELVDPRFYHLDTCFSVVNDRCAVFYPGAFAPAGQELLRQLFPEAIEVEESEAMRFACNGHCPDGKHVVLERRCEATAAALEERGFAVVPVDTGEFLKSGGSVFCLKLHYWSA